MRSQRVCLPQFRFVLPLLGALFFSYSTTSNALVHGADSLPMPDKQGGFEIGNGRTLIRNLAGRYTLKVPVQWEVGVSNKMTEIMTPQRKNIPRSRIQINILGADGIQSTQDLLLRKKDDEDWRPMDTNPRLTGIEKMTSDKNHLDSGHAALKMELLSQDKIVVISIWANPNDDETLDQLMEIAETVRLMNQ